MKTFNVLKLAVFIVSLLGIAVAVNFFAMRPEARVRFDATKTRAYSLSDQTLNLLKNLQGDWTITMLLAKDSTSAAQRRQIEEVLRRYEQASPNIHITYVDPTDPASLSRFDALIARLQDVYVDLIEQYTTALDTGSTAFSELHLFAQQQSAALGQVVARVAPEAAAANNLQQRVGTLSLLAQEGQLVAAEVSKSRKTESARPIPDYESARSILATALDQWAGELDAIAQSLGQMQASAETDPVARQYAATGIGRYQALSRRLAEAADPLKRLPPLELSTIGQQLAEGEGAVILGPNRAAVVPASQLLPKANVQLRGDGGVTFDQRFRGEQLISAAIRSLTLERMPLVVFVHGEEGSMLRQRARGQDLLGVSTVMYASRFDVMEWNAGSRAPRPTIPREQPVAWVIVPPPARAGLEPSDRELALLSATRLLIADGESVLVSMYPSLLPKYGQPDPWSALTEQLGVRADTSRAILERTTDATGAQQIQRGVAIQQFESEQPIARALDGQQLALALPVPIIDAQPPDPGIPMAARIVVAAVQPGRDRWLEADWAADESKLEAPSEQERLLAAVPVIMALERISPSGKPAPQRIVLVGCGGWMLSGSADKVQTVGGERVALVNPGNLELMMSSVAWLSGHEDLIARGPLSQEIPRLDGVTPELRLRWFWILGAGLPAACIALGVMVWMSRRG